MPTHSGPNIVDNGLVLSLDAADNNSFRGEPTTNLITNPLPNSTTGFNRAGGTGTVTYDSVKGAVYWEQTAYSTWGTYFNFHPSFGGTLDTGAQYTFSVEYLNESDFADSLFNHQLVQGNGVSSAASNGNITSHVTNLSDGWKRYSYTFTPNNTGVGTPYNRFMTGNRSSNVLRMYFRKIQFEKKSSRTRFTTGTRGTTVATGGGWKDLSGNNNHGEIINGVTTSNDQIPQGALEFDGVDDKIELPISLASLGSIGSIEVVFKADSNHRGALLGWGNLDTTHWGTFEIGPATSGFADEYIGYVNLTSGTSSDLSIWGRDSVAGSYKLSDGNFHHIIVVIDGIDNCFYVDGEKITPSFTNGSATLSSFIDVDSIQKIRVGDSTYNGGHIPFNGKIPLLRIYNRGLTQQEALDNYNSLKSRFGL